MLCGTFANIEINPKEFEHIAKKVFTRLKLNRMALIIGECDHKLIVLWCDVHCFE